MRGHGACLLGVAIAAGCSSVQPVREGVLYRSGQLTAQELESTVRKHDIRTVVNLRGSAHESWYREEARVLRDLDVKQIDLPVDSAAPDPDAVAELLDIYRSEEKPILVHSRSRFGSAGFASGLYRVAVEREPTTAARRELAPWQHHYLPFVPGAAHDRYLAEWRGEERFNAEHRVAKARRTTPRESPALEAGDRLEPEEPRVVQRRGRSVESEPSTEFSDEPTIVLGPPRPLAERTLARGAESERY